MSEDNETGPYPDQLEPPAREMTEREREHGGMSTVDTARLSPQLDPPSLDNARNEARARNAVSIPTVSELAAEKDAQVERLQKFARENPVPPPRPGVLAALHDDLLKFQAQQHPMARDLPRAERPTPGRIVLYTICHNIRPPDVFPAIVTGVDAEAEGVSIMVFSRMGCVPYQGVLMSEAPAGDPAADRKWSWPVRP